jgi:hypothetical protein
MIIEKLLPLVVGVGLCLMFKSTRIFSIVAIAATSYFYPVPFLVIGSMAGIGYGIYRWRRG